MTTTTTYTRWRVDSEHSQVHFSVQHLQIATVTGRFMGFSGELEGSPDNLAAACFKMRLQTQSLDTQDLDRDETLRSAPFFDVGRFPEIVFESQSIEPLDDERLRVTGLLHIKDQHLPLTFEAEYGGLLGADFDGLPRMGFSIELRLDRFAMGFLWDEKMPDGNPQVGPEVRVDIEMELVPDLPSEA